MWLWLQNKNKFSLRNFFKKIFFISLSIHFCLLFIFFFVLKDARLNLNIFLNKDLKNSNIPIVFLPFAKTVPGSINKLKSKAAQISTKRVSKSFVKPKKIRNKKITKKVIQKNLAKNKKIIDKKIKNDIKVKPKVVKKVEKIQKNEIVKNEQLKLPEIKNEVTKNETVKPPEVQDISKQAIKSDEPIAVYLGRDDVQAQSLVITIHNEIIKHWKPPKGLPTGLECSVNIKVNNEGRVTDLKFEKSSKVLIYDISLKNAILKTIMPNELKNRDFTLNLNC